MTRLPIPGQDDGTWGDILNAYLSVSLASDGTLKPNVVGTSQLQAGAVTSSNLSSSVQTSLNSANTALQLGGDLGGSNTAPTVSKLQGTTLNGSSPSNGQVLTYSTVASAWVPGTPSTTTVNDATTSSKGIVELAKGSWRDSQQSHRRLYAPSQCLTTEPGGNGQYHPELCGPQYRPDHWRS